MDPYEAIASLEVSLRGLINDVLGSDWQADCGVDVAGLEQRRLEESARRKGAAVDQHLLSYAHLYELKKIITKKWDKFHPVFDNKKRFDVYMDRIEAFRNAPMHSRELLPFERELLSGIVGEMRNLTTIFRSQQAPDRTHYPVVESIVDSFGNEMRKDWPQTNTELRLSVGDTVEFSCRGWDAQDRELRWRLQGNILTTIDRAVGASVTLRWAVVEGDVAEMSGPTIYMSSNGKYHRNGTWDFKHTVLYAVEPPAQ